MNTGKTKSQPIEELETLRWVRQRKLTDVEHRDRNGWRLFAEEDVPGLRARVNRVQKTSIIE